MILFNSSIQKQDYLDINAEILRFLFFSYAVANREAPTERFENGKPKPDALMILNGIGVILIPAIQIQYQCLIICVNKRSVCALQVGF